jgi:hypothetical protein
MAIRVVMTMVVIMGVLAVSMRMAVLVAMWMCVIVVVVVHAGDYRAVGSDRRAVLLRPQSQADQ